MRSVSFNRILHLALLGLALGLSTPVRAQQQVVIVTSVPK